jgi:plastocyanin
MEPSSDQPSFVSSGMSSTGGGSKRMVVIALAVVAVLVVGVMAFMLLKGGDKVDADKPVSTITIGTDGFVPATIKIKKGEELAWVNKDQSAHELTADQAAADGLNSAGPLAQDDSYVYKFEKTGTVNYYDPLNPTRYKGTVVVE